MNNSGHVTGRVQAANPVREHPFIWNGKTVRDVGGLGDPFGVGQAINDRGQFTGYTQDFDINYEGFFWDGSTLRTLGSLTGHSTQAVDINNLGHVTGGTTAFDPQSNKFVAFLWDGATAKKIDTLGGTESFGFAINGASQVTGIARIAKDGPSHAFLWDGSSMLDLGTLGGARSAGRAINASGKVTGESEIGQSGEVHAFLWNGSMMHDLGTLGGDHSGAEDINVVGEIVGSSRNPSGRFHAFIWNGTFMRDLGTLGGSESFASKLSNAGQVVGDANRSNDTRAAFLWDGTAIYDLNDLIDPADPLRSRVFLASAIDINNRGQILVTGRLDNVTIDRTFVLSPQVSHDLKDLTLNKAVTAGCRKVAATVTLTRAAPSGGAIVTIKDNLDSTSAPSTIKINAGLTSASFQMGTVPVTATESGSVTVILGGSSITKPLTVRPIGMKSVGLTPNPVKGGTTSAGIATLECRAGPGPITVSLSSSNSSVANPSTNSVVVAAGSTEKAFVVNTSPTTAIKSATIRAKANGITKSKSLTVTP